MIKTLHTPDASSAPTAILVQHPKRAGDKRLSRLQSLQNKPDNTYAETFAGLNKNTSHFNLLLFAKKAGKNAGFTPKMIQLLEYYMMFTRDIDWRKGGKPIVYQSQIRTAMDMGVSERQIQKLEKALFEVGALTWNDSGNHKRYGQRCKKSGAVVYAYGVDLRPLASLQSRLEQIVSAKKKYQAAWMETKRQISYYRAQIRRALEEHHTTENVQYGENYRAISYQIRQNLDLDALRHLLQAHKDLLNAIMTDVEAQKTHERTCISEKKFAHKESTIYIKPNKLESSRSPSANSLPKKQMGKSKYKEPSVQKAIKAKKQETGLEHIKPKHLYFSAREGFREYIPIAQRQMSWDDIVAAAHIYKNEIGIDQNLWGRGCAGLTRLGAAICVILTDHAVHRSENPIKNSAAYFQSLINKAEKGELRLHDSIFGLLSREEMITH